jgi:hypothetical protein
MANMVVNSQSGCQVAILELMAKIMTPVERLLKSLLIMFFKTKALHTSFWSYIKERDF